MRGKNVRGGFAVLWIALSLIFAVLVLFFLWHRGADIVPSEELPPSLPRIAEYSVFDGAKPVSAETPFPAPAPEIAAKTARSEVGEIVAEEEGLTVYRLTGKVYRGFLAVIDDPLRLRVGCSGAFTYGGHGKLLHDIADAEGAVLSVNGGGFSDDGGGGLGGEPVGNVYSDGKALWSGYADSVGMDADGVLHSHFFTQSECEELGIQWALSYGPTLVLDGEAQEVDDTLTDARTAVGQRADGTVLLICVQGRQASSLGISYKEMAELMVSLGAVTAANLDGGASSDMYYRGEYLNPSNGAAGPRPIPTILMVMPAGEVTE